MIVVSPSLVMSPKMIVPPSWFSREPLPATLPEAPSAVITNWS
jgi:hypothetical protein